MHAWRCSKVSMATVTYPVRNSVILHACIHWRCLGMCACLGQCLSIWRWKMLQLYMMAPSLVQVTALSKPN